ncbi:acyl carrier protein [Mesoplasma lactucae]|uniref:Acyl carrier protein n=1 Tax=Mesoplasma lactucae ATCC 49193 TaxID=81460 RepID=A0A291IS30_9MOLU|nr:phosphopantetheine-binding protein [Mesoplasma lactucae]ATG97570.1 acyl carrier protein [Mesoplasma lactucae ATCC 49193]ATZ19971.1 acyl carrier protein [Mesoplasma lactucae ATCC 49193]MCL8217078.1 Acyl carrier protein [Mesoplasma lactucae ATCC 49193]
MDYTDQIIKELKKQGVKGNLTSNTNLKEVGLDSLDLMDMVVKLEDKFNIMVPDEELENIKTIGDLDKLIIKLKG